MSSYLNIIILVTYTQCFSFVFSDYDRDAYRDSLKMQWEPYITSLRNIIVHSFYAVLIVFGIVVFIILFGVVILKYMKSRNMVRVIKIFETKYEPKELKDKRLAANIEETTERDIEDTSEERIK
jgi:hypothetical protein